MRILRVLSPKLAQFLLALAIIPGVAAGERVSTIRGAVATLGPGEMPVFLPGVQVVLRCEKLAKKNEARSSFSQSRVGENSNDRDRLAAVRAV